MEAAGQLRRMVLTSLTNASSINKQKRTTLCLVRFFIDTFYGIGFLRLLQRSHYL